MLKEVNVFYNSYYFYLIGICLKLCFLVSTKLKNILNQIQIMKKQLIECVPNFSEGRDMSIIKQITDEIERVEGVLLLNVDPGKATNRTVVTFVGEPQAVVQAAFLAIKKAAEVIDLSQHKGEHPRMGATDVCPLIPIAHITMEETAEWAKRLGQMVGDPLSIPVFLYEAAASQPERKNLATIRAGEYEGLAEKLKRPEWHPDFGNAVFNPKAGATVIGARDFLVAYNINLNTTSVRRANSVAFDVREQGRVVTDEKGKTLSAGLNMLHDIVPSTYQFNYREFSPDGKDLIITQKLAAPIEFSLQGYRHFLKYWSRMNATLENISVALADTYLGTVDGKTKADKIDQLKAEQQAVKLLKNQLDSGVRKNATVQEAIYFYLTNPD